MEENYKSPFFSVIVPVYNKGPYIKRSFKSILNQTFQDFELIVVCDPSTDNSLEEIEVFDDPRIRVFHRDTPGPGGYAARNLGIQEARGEWLAFLDADDEWRLNHLEKMKVLSQKYPEVYFLGCGCEEEFVDNHRKLDAFFLANQKTKHLKLSLEDYLKFSIEGKRPVNASIACLKRDSRIALDLFPSEIGATRGGDLHAWLKVICCHKEMAWSNHIGGCYFLNIAGSVVKSARLNMRLYEKDALSELFINLQKHELKLLKQYLNKRLFNIVKGLRINNITVKGVYKYAFFVGDFFGYIKIVVAYYVIPSSLFNGLMKI